MGGEGSGRRPSAETILAQARNNYSPVVINNEVLELPNYSGLQAVKKTDPAISVGGDGTNFWTSGSTKFYTIDQTKLISGSISGGTIWGTTISGSSVFSNGSAVLTSYTETDPIFLSLSGGFLKTETDPVWLSMSGSYLKTANLAANETDPKFISLSGSLPYINLSLSGSWNTDLASGSAHFVDSTDPHGTTLIQTSLSGSNVWSSLISGANIWAYGTISGSSLMTTEDHTTSGSAKIVGIITHTSATPPTASNYPQGTLYIQYTA